MRIYIKYMVSTRCKTAVKDILKKLNLHFIVVDLGEVDIMEDLSIEQRTELKTALYDSGLELMDDKKAVLIEKIQNVIIDMVHHSVEFPKSNYSDYISEKLNFDYTYLSNIFSEVKGITIQQFIIIHKIERAKELLIYDELNLTEISYKLDYSSVAHLSNQHMPGFELDFTKQTYGKKQWQQEYNYPQIGYSLIYYSFNPQKPVGNALALFIHAGKNFYKTKRSNLQWRLGFGNAYVERRFNVESNFKNNVISQRINFTISGQLNFNVNVLPRVALNFGLGMLHISNGSLKRPNFGINLPTVHAGIAYQFNKNAERIRKDSLPTVRRKTNYYVSTFMGLKEVYPVNGPKYFLGGANLLVERKYNRKSGLHTGLDISYDHSKKSEIAYDTLPVRNVFINRAQAGLLVGHELYMDKLSLLTQLGVYLYDPAHIDNRFYQKVGFKYYITENVYANLIMKIHLGVADWIEWGIGMRL